jgi:large subunit ribosomal protein L3
MKFILGKKLDMTQIWQGDKVIPVTRVQAGPCTVVRAKNKENERYEAVQIGWGEKKAKNMKKPQLGQLKGLGNYRYLREFRTAPGDLKLGDLITVSAFMPGDRIKVTSTSKGKGFQGVVRRHHFKGSKKTHGNKDQLRMPGSIGATGPQHVFKGTRMGGRMGGVRVTTKNLEIAGVEKESNILLIKGAVPGARNGLVMIAGEGELQVESLKVESEKPPKMSEEPKAENYAETPEKVEKEVVEAKEMVEAKKK